MGSRPQHQQRPEAGGPTADNRKELMERSSHRKHFAGEGKTYGSESCRLETVHLMPVRKAWNQRSVGNLATSSIHLERVTSRVSARIASDAGGGNLGR
jgi:hypothetical protein